MENYGEIGKVLVNLYKLKKDEHDWKIHTIPEGRKVPFKVMGQIAREDVEQSVMGVLYAKVYIKR